MKPKVQSPVPPEKIKKQKEERKLYILECHLRESLRI
jgi:hypothetical protein